MVPPTFIIGPVEARKLRCSNNHLIMPEYAPVSVSEGNRITPKRSLN